MPRIDKKRFEALLLLIKQHGREFCLTEEDVEETFRRFLERTPEDCRVASQMAVDASKTLVTIGVALFAAVGGFIQFAVKSNLAWNSSPLLFFYAAAASIFVSMCFGFNAIGYIFQRGEGRRRFKSDPPWWTGNIAPLLNLQGILGALALVFFAAAIISWSIREKVPPKTISIVLGEEKLDLTAIETPIEIQGHCSIVTISRDEIADVKLGGGDLTQLQSFMMNIK